jgi:hypothetical protein
MPLFSCKKNRENKKNKKSWWAVSKKMQRSERILGGVRVTLLCRDYSQPKKRRERWDFCAKRRSESAGVRVTLLCWDYSQPKKRRERREFFCQQEKGKSAVY